MEYNQPYPINPQQTGLNEAGFQGKVGASSGPKGKALLLVIALITAVVVVLIILVVFVINKNQSEDVLPAGRDNNATLQLYATLEDGIPLENIESAVKEKNNDANIDIDQGFGTINLPSSEGESIIFYFETEETAAELNEGSDTLNGEKIYQPNIAYGFTYVSSLGADNAATISYSDDGIFYYYDGLDSYEFPTKQDAIDAYLAPVLEDLE